MSARSDNAKWAYSLLRDKEWKSVGVTVGGNSDLRRLRQQVTLLLWVVVMEGFAIAFIGLALFARH